ncbi:hypothetical protein D3C79_703890 [compost metagenome]
MLVLQRFVDVKSITDRLGTPKTTFQTSACDPTEACCFDTHALRSQSKHTPSVPPPEQQKPQSNR